MMGCSGSTEKENDQKNAPAPAPTSTLKAIELMYFDGPGRAELTRKAFNEGGVDFKDVRVTNWETVKADPNSAPAQCFGSMPVIVQGEFLLAQSLATAQYAADLGINSKKSPTAQQRSLDMMVLGAHADLQAAMYACVFGTEESKTKGKVDLPGKVQPLLSGLERLYSGPGPYLYSFSPTLGDLAVANIVTSPFPGLKALGVDLSPYPKLEACVSACQEGQQSQGEVRQPLVEGELELVYFSGPGRAELTRLALHAGGVPFKDTRVPMGPEWQSLKADPNSAPAQCFGSMPVIVHGKHMVAQSTATAQYAADLGINKLKPPTAQQRALDTMVLGAHADLQAAMYKCLFGTDESKAKGREELEGKVYPLLAGLERMYKGGGPFLYASESEGPTLGDLAVLNAVSSPFPGLVALQVDLSAYPKLNACVAACKTNTARPGLKQYLGA
mmetsp:Transcript_6811/g.10967  ORF Transcript_6811/g.10967 Transcript_6811/m.10967 type:complete len:444 (+) Transcript_6811:54-1385(+)